MPVSSDIYGQIQPQQQRNPLADAAQVMQLQHAMGANALNTYQLAKARREDADANALSELYRTPGVLKADGTVDGGALVRGAADRGLGARIPTIQKGLAEADKARVEVEKEKLAAAKQRTELAGQAFGYVRANPTVENAHSAIDLMQTNGILAPQVAAQYKASINPQNVGQFADQMFRTSLQARDQLSKYETRDTGGAVQTLAIDPVSGKVTPVSSVAKSVSPDAQLHADVSVANNRRTIAAENLRAGVSADGKMDDNSERTAQAIASGQLPAPTGMALLNPKNQRILGRVMEINPQYDATTVDAKRKAARDFGSGTLGNSMRSFAVAGQHLDQLGELVDALNNGNLQAVNKVGNMIAAQTGNPAPTNFDAAKDVVSKEVVKAIVAGGGGVSERQELSHLMDNAKTPAQLKGVIQQYRNLMAAQHDALLQQRRAAGLPDSTLPNYTDANGSSNTPPSSGLQIDPKSIAAELARRGVK